ncbi:Hypothetical_protein [Hexamita inflata]|uniref:Hypothetical_protein n=1 Tax=Hexamita inflata TaxID=28002 RepID=A0AA86U6M0_9EUKA|nr:Hypothetical protein HINF_LOCUS32520 [Hexamita inflata]
MKKTMKIQIDEHQTYANNVILQGVDQREIVYKGNDAFFDNQASTMQFNIPKDWSSAKKQEQLNKYQKKPELDPENIEQFVRRFSTDSLTISQKLNSSTLTPRTRLRRQYFAKGDTSPLNNVSFEVRGSPQGIQCNLSNLSGVINASKEFDQ